MKIIHLLPEIAPEALSKSSVGVKKPRGGHGRSHNNAKIPAEVILKMRRMHEIERKTRKQVGDAFPDIDESYVYSILGYICRANLKVKP